MKQIFALLAACLICCASPIWAAMYQVKQSSTAYPLVFFMTDSADHVTGKTGLTCTVTLSKAGGSFASPSGSVSEIANGWYKVAGNATDAGTLGLLVLHATASGADATDATFEVVAVDPQSATAFVTGINSLAPPTNWNSINVTNLNTLSGHDPGATLGTSTLTQPQVTGGAYALSTDANGRMRIVDGTGTGEIDTSSGGVAHVVLVDTSTNLTNLPTIPNNWIAAAGIATNAFSDTKFTTTAAKKIGYYGGCIDSGTISALTSNTSFTVALAKFQDSADNDRPAGLTVIVTDVNQGFAEERRIVSYNATSGVMVIDTATSFDIETSDTVDVYVGERRTMIAGAANGLFIAGTNAQATVTSGWGAGTIAATSFASGAIDAAAIAANAIGSSEVADGAIDAAALASDTISAAKIAADVTTEILGPIMADTAAEPTGTPAANATLATKISWIFMGWRNGMTVTASERTLLDDGGSEEVDWELSDDGTTTTVSEAATAD